MERITHVGKFWTRDGQQPQRANVIGNGESPIFIHRKNQAIIDQHRALKQEAERLKEDATCDHPEANYYHS
jgi:hypothetical protein